ncbi:unnamed protein product [Camellia sinensis]
MAMKNMKSPFRGIINDFKRRKTFIYFRILSPATYIFCASALPVIVFEEQLDRETDGSLSTVDTLASTAICGIIHSIFGGQPLLILGVAEPRVIMYTYLYNFTKEKVDLGQELFLAWAGWVCVWTAILLLLLAAFNACTIISRFTRIAGKLFGTLIAVLFMQEAIKQRSKDMELRHRMATKFHYRLWGSLYGSNMVTNVIWCTYQYSFRSSQEALWSTSLGVCLFAPLDGNQADMGKVPVVFIFATFIPAVMIAGLYFFYHCVASQMAQQKEFNLKNPFGYHYDILLLGIMRRDAVAKELKNLKDAVMKSEDGGSKDGNDLEKHIDAHLPVRVNEQRVSNLLQSLLVRASLLAMPAIKMIPTSVLWGYFAYMALDSLPGNQFCEKILLLFITPKKRYKYLQELDAAEYEEITGNRNRSQSMPFMDGDKPLTGNENHEFESSDAEILDEFTTNRGELKFR